jgi:hypothetical protein
VPVASPVEVDAHLRVHLLTLCEGDHGPLRSPAQPQVELRPRPLTPPTDHSRQEASNGQTRSDAISPATHLHIVRAMWRWAAQRPPDGRMKLRSGGRRLSCSSIHFSSCTTWLHDQNSHPGQRPRSVHPRLPAPNRHASRHHHHASSPRAGAGLTSGRSGCARACGPTTTGRGWRWRPPGPGAATGSSPGSGPARPSPCKHRHGGANISRGEDPCHDCSVTQAWVWGLTWHTRARCPRRR